MTIQLTRLLSCSCSGLRLRSQWSLSSHISRRYVQEFPGLRLDNSTPKDYLLVLPESLDETSQNELLRIPKRGEPEIDFSKLNPEVCFKGLSQAICSFDNFITDVNNQTNPPHESIRELFHDVEKSLFPMDSAYNILMILLNFEGQKYNYDEIYQLIKRYIKARDRRFTGQLKAILQRKIFDENQNLTLSEKKMLKIYGLSTRKREGVVPLDENSVHCFKENLENDLKFFITNLQIANNLFSHTVDDPDILAAVSSEFDDCHDLHHKERTPLQVNVNTYQRFMRVCPDRFVRQMLWQTYNRRCSPKGLPKNNNLLILNNIRVTRRKIADFAGYRSHLDSKLEGTMAASRQNVLDSLEAINKENSEKLSFCLQELYDYASDNSFSDPNRLGLREYDLDYWSNKYAHDILIGKSESELKGYFPFASVMQGLQDYFKTYFSIEFKVKKSTGDKFWGDNVHFMELSRKGEPLGSIIYDPFQRGARNDSFYARIRSRVQGAEHLPARLISTQFNLDDLRTQANLSVSEVINLFYYFSTVIQRLMYNYRYYELNTYGGLEEDVKRLVPYLCTAHLCTDYRILQSCSNRGDSKPIDSELASRILRATAYTKPFKTWYELYQAHLDVEAHTSVADIKNIAPTIYGNYCPFQRDTDNFDYCSMSGIFVGPNDGLQYGELWSKQLANYCLKHVQNADGKLDKQRTKVMFDKLLDSLYGPEDLSTDEKLASLLEHRFEPSKFGLGVL